MKKIRNSVRVIIAFALIAIAATSCAQAGGNPVLQNLFDKYRSSNNDTNRVRLLLQIDSLYLYKMADTRTILDSALLMARQARDLSVALQFKPGYEDASFLLANSLAEKNDMSSANAFSNKTEGSLKIHILIMLAERYIFRPGELKQNLDSAHPYITKAISLSKSLGSVTNLSKSFCVLGKYYFAYGKIDSGKQCFKRIISYYHRQNDKEREANWWAELGRYMPHTDSTYNDVLYSLKQSNLLYHQLNSQEEPHVTEDIAYLLMVNGSLDESEAGYFKAIQLRKSFNKKNLFEDYLNIAKINIAKGKYNTALYYALAAKNNVDSLHDESMRGVIYSVLGEANKALGETDKSLQWYQSALSQLVDYKNEYTFTISAQIVHLMLLKGDVHEALSFLSDFLKSHTPARLNDKEIIAYCYGDCYTALKNYDVAEKYYQQMISLDGLVQSHSINTTQAERANIITGSQAYYTMGKFYVDIKLYEAAKPFLISAMQVKRFLPTLSLLSNIHLMLFKVDSAQGQYLSAINHFERYKSLNDTIFNVAKSRQIEELQIKYETQQKEQDIEILNKSSKVQETKLREAHIVRNFTFFGIGLLLIIIFLLYYQYKIKQRNNKEIGKKNNVLQQLVEEKEWLLKEIHHRVKNNLQIVISLLNTQSKYVDSEEAKDAILESSHRMQAISLIHQKLYQLENTTSVNMPTYITELAAYLETSFNAGKNLHFNLQVESIDLDVAQAIPVGLILNEAITNAIKYAFIDRTNGTISIKMQHGGNSYVMLEVHDNGTGLPDEISKNSAGTMGMRLMKGLVKQLEGKLSIENQQGVRIRVEFKTATVMKTISIEGVSIQQQTLS